MLLTQAFVTLLAFTVVIAAPLPVKQLHALPNGSLSHETREMDGDAASRQENELHKRGFRDLFKSKKSNSKPEQDTSVKPYTIFPRPDQQTHLSTPGAGPSNQGQGTGNAPAGPSNQNAASRPAPRRASTLPPAYHQGNYYQYVRPPSGVPPSSPQQAQGQGQAHGQGQGQSQGRGGGAIPPVQPHPTAGHSNASSIRPPPNQRQATANQHSSPSQQQATGSQHPPPAQQQTPGNPPTQGILLPSRSGEASNRRLPVLPPALPWRDPDTVVRKPVRGKTTG